jgi:cell pole-organizing protein PopZ
MGEIQQDPSMEEILASIKRVIREDGRAPGQPRAPRRAARAETPPPPIANEDEVLELTESVEDPALVSPDAAAASRQSLAALSSMRGRDPGLDTGPLEAVIREMLRPMLKDWLDEHLPQIVEELVTREIARITGRQL